MKIIKIVFWLAAVTAFFPGCKKWADDKQNIYKYVAPPPPPGSVVSNATPLCGSVRGTMEAGKTFILACDINVPAGDTLIVQSGVTIYATNSAGIVVHGSLISLGTQQAPNIFTVQGVTKNHTPGLQLSKDSAHIGLWRGIMCDTSCPMLILKWTHVDFAGASYGNV